MSGVGILPYTQIDGIPTFADSGLVDLYGRFEDSSQGWGLYRDGSAGFVREVKSGRTLLYAVIVDGSPGGLLLLDGFRARYAHAHISVFREFWGRTHRGKGRFAVETVLQSRDASGDFLWDGFIGMIPPANRLAIRYAKDCGFKDVGLVPFGNFNWKEGRSEPAWMLTLERGVYE